MSLHHGSPSALQTDSRGLSGQTTPAATQGRQSWAVVRGQLAGRGQNPLHLYGCPLHPHPPVLLSSCPPTSEVFSMKTSSQGTALVKGLVLWGGDTVPYGQCVKGGRKIRAFLFWVFFFKGACLSM